MRTLARGCCSDNVKHFNTKPYWVQGAIESHGVKVQKVPRAENASPIPLVDQRREMAFSGSGTTTLWSGRGGMCDTEQFSGNQCGCKSLGKTMWDVGAALASVSLAAFV